MIYKKKYQFKTFRQLQDEATRSKETKTLRKVGPW